MSTSLTRPTSKTLQFLILFLHISLLFVLILLRIIVNMSFLTIVLLFQLKPGIIDQVMYLTKYSIICQIKYIVIYPLPITPCFCYICHLSKQRRLACISNNHVEYETFALLHCDIQDLYNAATYHGQTYFLTMDDHSRFTWTYLLAHKSEASSLIQKIFKMVETRFHKTIKVFRSDNAS